MAAVESKLNQNIEEIDGRIKSLQKTVQNLTKKIEGIIDERKKIMEIYEDTVGIRIDQEDV